MTTNSTINDAPEEIDEFIELIKQGEYGYTVNLGGTGEEPLTGVNMENATALPTDEVHEEFERLFDDIAIQLATILNKQEGCDLAYEFGRVVVESASTHPYLTEDNVCDIIDLDGVEQHDVEAYIAFYTIYPDANYPDGVHVETVAKLAGLYDASKTRNIISKLHENGLQSNDTILTAYENAIEITVESISNILLEHGVDNVGEGVVVAHVIAQKPIPKNVEQRVDAAIESYSEDNPGTSTDANKNTDAYRFVAQDVISELEAAAGEFDSTVDAFQYALDEINSSNEFEGLDKYWQLGSALKQFKPRVDMNYSDLFDEFDVGISQSYGSRARRLTEIFNYKEYPDELSLNDIYQISTGAESDEETKEIIQRITDKGVSVRQKSIDVWKDLTDPAPSELIEYMESQEIEITAENIAEITVLYNDDVIECGSVLTVLEDQNTAKETRGENGMSGEITGFNKTLGEEHEPGQDNDENTTCRESDADIEHSETQTQTNIYASKDVGDGGYSETVREDERVTVTDTGVKATDREYETALGEKYSHSLPSETVINGISGFDAVTHVIKETPYWSHVLCEHTDTNITTLQLTPPGGEMGADSLVSEGNSTVVEGSPYSVIEHTESCSQPILFTWPEDGNDEATLALTAYAANGGDTVLYLGEWWGGEASTEFITQLTKHYECALRVTPMQWESNSDALYVYTRTGELPDALTGKENELQQQNGLVGGEE